MIYENKEINEREVTNPNSNTHSFQVELPDISSMLHEFQDFANEIIKPGIDDWFNSEYNNNILFYCK